MVLITLIDLNLFSPVATIYIQIGKLMKVLLSQVSKKWCSSSIGFAQS